MVHTHRDEGFAYWPRCEEFGGVKTKHKAFNPILEKIDLLKAQIEKKKEVRKVKIFKKFKLKEPYWFLNKEVIKIGRNNGYNLLHVIKIWIKTQFYYYKQLHFRKCGDSTSSHFLDTNCYCLRCKKILAEIDRERHVKKVNDSIFSQADIDRVYNNSNAEIQFTQGYSILEPIWNTLMSYMNTLKNYQRFNRRYNTQVGNPNGLQEYLEILKEDIAAGVGIPVNQLFAPLETESSLMTNERAYLENFRERVRRLQAQGTPWEHFPSSPREDTLDAMSIFTSQPKMIQITKEDVDNWKNKRLSLLQRFYKKLFPTRWEVKEKVKAYVIRKNMEKVVNQTDQFIAYGDTLQPMNEGGIITEEHLNRLRELAENRVNRIGGIFPMRNRNQGRTALLIQRCLEVNGIFIVHSVDFAQQLRTQYPDLDVRVLGDQTLIGEMRAIIYDHYITDRGLQGTRLVTEEQHLLEEGLRREMEEQMRQAVLQNGMIPRSHGREHNPEWYSEMMQNPQPTPEPQNYGTLEGYAQREGDLPDLRVDTVNRINEALREASTIISGIIGNRVGDMYNGRDDMYSERLERLCYTMVNRMITPNFTLNSIEYINRNERDFLESIRFSQRIVRDGSYEYENFQRVKPTIYQARLGDIIYLPKVLNIELRKGNLVVQNINGELVRTLIENDAIGVVEEPSFMTQDSDYRLVRIKMLKGVNVIIKNGTLVKKVKFKPKPKPKEFKVSDLITLRLEPKNEYLNRDYGKLITNIYIKGKKFNSCKYLLLNLEYGNEYEDIESIDDAAKKLGVDHPNRDMEIRNRYIVLPEEEFWGHCSNLQCFVEYDYDLRVLHSNLSLPLLKELAQYDDHAKLRLKEQIAEKIEKGGYKALMTHETIIKKYFTKEEIDSLSEFIKLPRGTKIGMKKVIIEEGYGMISPDDLEEGLELDDNNADDLFELDENNAEMRWDGHREDMTEL